MNNYKLFLVLIAWVFFFSFVVAQEKNPLTDRDFWKDKPSIETVQQKIDEGCSLSDVNYYGYAALSWAILYANDLEITKLLVENGSDIHRKIVRYGRTPVFWAVRGNNFEILEYLSSKGAKLDMEDKNGHNLLMYAAYSGASDRRIYDFLLDRGLKFTIDEDGRTALLLYVRNKANLEMIDYFLGKGMSIEDVSKYGDGVFNYASRNKDINLLYALIERGASYKANHKTGENAFMFCTKGSYHNGGSPLTIDFLRYLESLGLDPLGLDRSVVTTADSESNREVGACLNNISYSEKNLDIFKYFIKKGADPNKTNTRGDTPLAMASYRNTKEVVDYLMSVSKDVNHRNNKGHTALSNAIRRNKLEVIIHLIENGASIDIKDDKGNDLGALLVDSYRGSNMKSLREKMGILIKYGYKPKNASVQNGNGLLQVAIRNGNPKLVEEIINMKIPIDKKNDEGYAPIHVAAMTAKDDKIMKLLLVAGAKKHIKTLFKESAYDLALENELLKGVDVSFLKK